MRTRGRALPFAAVAAALLALLGWSVVALAVNGAALVGLAEGSPYFMTCSPNGSAAHCVRGTFTYEPDTADIDPASGQFSLLRTTGIATDGPLTQNSKDWMVAMHSAACGDQKGAAAFVTLVTSQLKDFTAPPTPVGTCTMYGTAKPSVYPPTYVVTSKFVPPPTPKPTKKPTPKPTIAPTPAPTVSPTPEPTTSPTPSPSPTPTPTASPSASPSPTPLVGPVVATPAPTATLAPSVTGGCKVGCGSSSFVDAIPDLGNIQTDAVSLGGSGALLALILLIIGFAAELFNNTVENNYDEISGWFQKGGLGHANRWVQRHLRLGVLGFLLLTALVSSFVDPQFGPDARGVVEFSGFLVGVMVVLASFKLPPMLAHRRKTGELGRLRPLPWALVISAAFVLVSRLGNLQPGYLYGIILGAIFTREVSNDEEGRETIYGSIWTLFASLISWVLLTAVRGQGLAANDPFNLFAQTALGCVLVSGLEATAFGLMPLRFMPGYLIYRWNRPLWAVLFGISVFAFIQILIGPTSGYVSALNPAAFFAAGGIFAIFGAFSLLTWGFFRFRPAPQAQELER